MRNVAGWLNYPCINFLYSLFVAYFIVRVMDFIIFNSLFRPISRTLFSSSWILNPFVSSVWWIVVCGSVFRFHYVWTYADWRECLTKTPTNGMGQWYGKYLLQSLAMAVFDGFGGGSDDDDVLCDSPNAMQIRLKSVNCTSEIGAYICCCCYGTMMTIVIIFMHFPSSCSFVLIFLHTQQLRREWMNGSNWAPRACTAHIHTV